MKKVITRNTRAFEYGRKVKPVIVPVPVLKTPGVRGLVQAKGEALTACRARLDEVNAGPFRGLVRQVTYFPEASGQASRIVVGLECSCRALNRIKAYRDVYLNKVNDGGYKLA